MSFARGSIGNIKFNASLLKLLDQEEGSTLHFKNVIRLADQIYTLSTKATGNIVNLREGSTLEVRNSIDSAGVELFYSVEQ